MSVTRVVAVGASAGGLDALERFFRNAAGHPSLAYVVIQHLSPSLSSDMVPLLARCTEMDVQHATSGASIEGGSVHVLPPGKTMVYAGGTLVLATRTETIAHPIDQFFDTMGRSLGAQCAAVILSGTGTDGTFGGKVVAEHGGFVAAQDPATATFGGMPTSLMATVNVDVVASPEEIGTAILGWLEEPEDEGEVASDVLESLIERVDAQLGLDFSPYRRTTLRRRLQRHARSQGQSVPELVAAAGNDPAALAHIAQRFLIGVSSFFRDPSCFERLGELIESQRLCQVGRPLRVWVAACAGGEEAYSVAMLLSEAFEAASVPPNFVVFATDIDERAVKRASAGVFSATQLTGLSDERRKRHFEPEGEGFRVSESLRARVRVTQHDMLRDPPFTNVDIVLCRNALIYVDESAQSRALTYFHFGLRPKGILVLGTSENVPAHSTMFRALSFEHRIYERMERSVALPATRTRPKRSGMSPPVELLESPDNTYDRLCDRFLPPSVLLDDQQRVLEFFGGAERFVSIKGRRVDLAFSALFDTEQRGTLAAALRRVAERSETVVLRGIAAGSPPSAVDLRFEPMLVNETQPRVLVVFEDAVREVKSEATSEVTVFRASADARSEIAVLEDELAHAQHRLQYTVEQLASSNEELQAAYEELLSSNEELHTTNEEMRSVNEQLRAVNANHHASIRELRTANQDIRHLLRNTDIATLFLDTELCVRRFTPGISEIVDLATDDVGRRFASFHHRLEWVGFLDAIARVRDENVVIQHEADSSQGTPFLVRISPIEDAEGGRAGVVVTLTDISVLRNAQRGEEEQRERLERLTNELPILIAYVDRLETYSFVNETYTEVWGRSRADIVGRTMNELMPAAGYAAARPHIWAALEGERRDFEHTVEDASSGKTLRLLTSYIPHETKGTVHGFYVSSTDISTRYAHGLELQDARERANLASRAKSEFLANMSHEIRTPLTSILGYADLLAEQLPDAGAQKKLHTIRSNGEHLLAIINDVLDLSRVEAGGVSARLGSFALREMFTGVHEMLRLRADEQGIDFRLDIEESVPEYAISDPQRLRQVLLNLTANALKFTSEGEVVVQAMCTGSPQRLQVSVRDTGVGFPAEEAERLFEAFHQADNSGARKFKGTGLGLTISARLVHALGGSIRASGEVGKGAVFSFEIPVETTDGSVEAKKSKPPAPTTALSAKLLVVDDNDDVRDLLVQALSGRGADVSSAGSGNAALELVKDDSSFDVILMDVQMPGLDGLETTRRLRARGLDTPIIAVTARALQADREECVEAGMNDYLPKPVQFDQLFQCVSRFLSLRILVAEDDVDSGELLAMMLRRRGMEVKLVSSVAAALEAVDAFEPDAVLSDLTLGQKDDGLALARALRSKFSDLRLVAYTGYTGYTELARDAGFDAVLTKPTAAGDIAAALRSTTRLLEA